MTRFRSLLLARRWLALAIVLAALAVRLVVPAGLMPARGTGGATLIVCSGHMAMGAMPGMATPAARHAAAKGVPAKDGPCAFTDLLAAAVDGPALPVLPAMPLPVTVAVVLTGAAAIVRRTRRLRPPLRGPPALAAA